MVVVLDLRPFHYFKTDGGEKVLHPLHGARNRVNTAGGLATPWQCDIDGLAASFASTAADSSAALRSPSSAWLFADHVDLRAGGGRSSTDSWPRPSAAR